MMATFLMVKKKRKRKLPCDWRIGLENWKRQMIRKIHLQFQISASSLLIYSWYPRISGNSWPCLRKHRLSVQVQKLIVAVIGEAFPRPTFVSNFIATIDSAPAVFHFTFRKIPSSFFYSLFSIPFSLFQFKLAGSRGKGAREGESEIVERRFENIGLIKSRISVYKLCARRVTHTWR